MTPTGPITVEQANEALTVYGYKLPTPTPDKRFNLVEQNGGTLKLSPLTVTDVNTGGSCVKANGCDKAEIVAADFFAVGAKQFPPRPGGSTSDAGAWVGTNCIGGSAAEWYIGHSIFRGSCVGSGYGTLLYIQGDVVRVNGCTFDESGQTFYMPSLRTPTSKPTIIFEGCTFKAGEYWYERAATWWPSVGLTVHSAARLICLNCTWEGTWRHLFRYVDPAKYVGIGNDYSKLKAHDPAVLIGTAAGAWMTLDQWCADGREIGVTR